MGVAAGASVVAVGELVPWPQATAKSRNRPNAMTIANPINLRTIAYLPVGLGCFPIGINVVGSGLVDMSREEFK
jgi:hypothetical protein